MAKLLRNHVLGNDIVIENAGLFSSTFLKTCLIVFLKTVCER